MGRIWTKVSTPLEYVAAHELWRATQGVLLRSIDAVIKRTITIVVERACLGMRSEPRDEFNLATHGSQPFRRQATARLSSSPESIRSPTSKVINKH